MNTKREQILDTALKLFVTNGFHATPTSRIAKDAGVATGTLFHYFKTKEELINTLYLEIKDNLTNSLLENVNAQETLKAKLRQIFFNYIVWAVDHPNHQQFYTSYSNSPFITNLTKELGLQRFQFIYELIEKGQDEDILKAVPIDLLVEAMQGLLNGIIKHLMENPEKMNEEKYQNDAFKLFWDTIKG